MVVCCKFQRQFIKLEFKVISFNGFFSLIFKIEIVQE
jgi:hypothetical protein